MTMLWANLDNPIATPIIVGGLVSCIVLTILGFTLFTKNLTKKKKKKFKDNVDIWEPANQTSANRRNSLRREGNYVPILVTSTALKSQQDEAIVIDRSTGGLKLGCRTEIPVGSVLQVRAKNAPNDTPWITVVVRNYRFSNNLHEVGVEFESTPPWNLLLLFG